MLKKLEIDLESYENKTNLQSQNKMKLFRNLQTLKNLKSLKLNFDSSNIISEDLSEFYQKLVQLKKLREISISMSEVARNFDKGLTSIAKAIETLKKLDNVNLNVKNTSTTE